MTDERGRQKGGHPRRTQIQGQSGRVKQKNGQKNKGRNDREEGAEKQGGA